MSKDLSLPFSENQAKEITDNFGSPVYVYDEAGIIDTAKNLSSAFAWSKNYKNYFAVKATPTPAILKILHEQGMGFDCSSRTELLMVERLGVNGEDIFYTSNNTPKADFELAIKIGATINIDDLTQVPIFLDALGEEAYERVALRYNPGDLKEGNEIIGKPVEAKYGMTRPQLIEAYKLLSQNGVKNFGLHTMVASNELNTNYFAETAEILLDTIDFIETNLGILISFVNLGGGFGLNYRPEEASFDMAEAGEAIRKVFQARAKGIMLFTENGRAVTGPHGYLITKVQYVMQKYKTYLGVDASMHNLMRPGMYGAYHHITILGKEDSGLHETYDVVGALCENNDKFAIDRKLPKASVGDLVIVHDVGAHGHSMGFNYNGLLRSAEVLLKSTGETTLIRKAETEEDYFKNVIW